MPPRPRKPRASAPRQPRTIEVVRAIRKQMWKDAGGTIEGLIRLARQEAARLPETKPPVRKRKSHKAA